MLMSPDGGGGAKGGEQQQAVGTPSPRPNDADHDPADEAEERTVPVDVGRVGDEEDDVGREEEEDEDEEDEGEGETTYGEEGDAANIMVGEETRDEEGDAADIMVGEETRDEEAWARHAEGQKHTELEDGTVIDEGFEEDETHTRTHIQRRVVMVEEGASQADIDAAVANAGGAPAPGEEVTGTEEATGGEEQETQVGEGEHDETILEKVQEAAEGAAETVVASAQRADEEDAGAEETGAEAASEDADAGAEPKRAPRPLI